MPTPRATRVPAIKPISGMVKALLVIVVVYARNPVSVWQLKLLPRRPLPFVPTKFPPQMRLGKCVTWLNASLRAALTCVASAASENAIVLETE
jgi:hypothetical protein